MAGCAMSFEVMFQSMAPLTRLFSESVALPSVVPSGSGLLCTAFRYMTILDMDGLPERGGLELLCDSVKIHQVNVEPDIEKEKVNHSKRNFMMLGINIAPRMKATATSYSTFFGLVLNTHIQKLQHYLHASSVNNQRKFPHSSASKAAFYFHDGTPPAPVKNHSASYDAQFNVHGEANGFDKGSMPSSLLSSSD